MCNPFRRTSRPESIDLEQQAIDTLRGVGTDRANALADEIERGRERRERVRCGCGQWDSGWRESQKIAADHALRHVTSQWEDWRD